MDDPGCGYKDSDDAARCGKAPTQTLALGMTAPSRERGGWSGQAGESEYAHFCEEQLPVIRQRLGQHT